MSTTPPLPPLSQPSGDRPSPLDRELLSFLREESAANRAALREDAEANRKLLRDTIRLAAFPLTAIIVVAGFFGWRSFTTLKQSIQNEAQQETQAEIAQMQTEIRKKLQAQFKTPQLRHMVQEAASAQTGKVLRPMIQQEVRNDVSRKVRAQQPTINATIVSESHKAVDALEPTIDSIVSKRVNATVDQSVDREISAKVKPVLGSLQQSQQIAQLVLQAETGDGRAFDEMVALATNRSTPVELQKSMFRAAREIMGQHNGVYMARRFMRPTTNEEMLKYLRDPDPWNRQAALDSLPLKVLRKHLDELYRIMTTDPNLDVRQSGFTRFKQLIRTGGQKANIENLDNYTAAKWYAAHRQEMIEGKVPKP